MAVALSTGLVFGGAYTVKSANTSYADGETPVTEYVDLVDMEIEPSEMGVNPAKDIPGYVYLRTEYD